MKNDLMNLLEIFQSRLGSSRASCDDNGKALWDRVEAAKLAQIDACLYAAELEAAVLEVANGERKAAKLPTEPMVRLIHFARTGSVKNATARAMPDDQRERMAFYEEAMRDRKNHGALALELAYLRSQVDGTAHAAWCSAVPGKCNCSNAGVAVPPHDPTSPRTTDGGAA